MADEKSKHDDEKDEKKDAPAPATETTPRPDPVGERNYAMSQPAVRPEGEGTPGPMHQTPLPAAVATTPEQVPQQVERHATESKAAAPVPEDTHRSAAPAVPVVASRAAVPVHPVVPAAPKSESAKVPELEKPKRGARKK